MATAKVKYEVVYYAEKPCGYTVEVVGLGYTCGDNLKEARYMAKDLIKLFHETESPKKIEEHKKQFERWRMGRRKKIRKTVVVSYNPDAHKRFVWTKRKEKFNVMGWDRVVRVEEWELPYCKEWEAEDKLKHKLNRYTTYVISKRDGIWTGECKELGLVSHGMTEYDATERLLDKWQQLLESKSPSELRAIMEHNGVDFSKPVPRGPVVGPPFFTTVNHGNGGRTVEQTARMFD